MTRGLLPVTALFALGGSAAARADAPAPTLEVASDPPVPFPSLGIVVDPLGPLAHRFELRLERAWRRAHSALMDSGWRRDHGAHHLTLSGGYHLWPLGRGLSGPFLGLTAGLTWRVTHASFSAAIASFELGYQFLWRGIVLGLRTRLETLLPRWHLSPTLGLLLGWVPCTS